jgi:hypothetical protein
MFTCLSGLGALTATVSQSGDDGSNAYNVIMIVLTLIQILLGLGPSA